MVLFRCVRSGAVRAKRAMDAARRTRVRLQLPRTDSRADNVGAISAFPVADLTYSRVLLSAPGVLISIPRNLLHQPADIRCWTVDVITHKPSHAIHVDWLKHRLLWKVKTLDTYLPINNTVWKYRNCAITLSSQSENRFSVFTETR